MGVSKRQLAGAVNSGLVSSLRMELTGIYTTFQLTPSGTHSAEVVGVSMHPNASSGPISMSFSLVSVGAPGGNILAATNGGFFTGVLQGGSIYTASLHATQAQRVIAAGSLCYLSSTNHTGNMAVTVYYRQNVNIYS